MRIFGWPADWHGCAYYRVEQPLAELARRGHDVHVAPIARGAAGEQMMAADTILAQRVCLPHPTARWQCLRNVHRADYQRWLTAGAEHHRDLVEIHRQATGRDRRHHLVLDLDDDLWRIDPSNTGAWAVYSDPGMRARLAQNVARADAVTTTTARLAARLAELNRNVHVIPNAIPAWLLTHNKPTRNPRVVTIGWAGSSTHAMDWAECDTALRTVIGHTRTELHVMGDWSPTWSRVPPERVRITRWITGVETYHRAIDFDIGLAPLARHPFNEAKSPIKALEYAALGIPVIASPVGPYADFVQDGVTGLLARTSADWKRHLKTLIHDPDARRELGAAARRLAAAFTIQAVAPLWERVLTP
jgi:glycosyltransferase involved in cell wall biosynthesis